MHFVIHVFSNHAEVLHSVTPIDLPVQSAILSDGVVVACLHKSISLRISKSIDDSIFQPPIVSLLTEKGKYGTAILKTDGK